MFEASALMAIIPYVFIAAFPLAGIAIVTKWIMDDRKKSR